jgi:hypothetical protein
MPAVRRALGLSFLPLLLFPAVTAGQITSGSSAQVPVGVEVVNKLGTPVIAAVSAFYVWLQYRRARRWKATDLAASLVGTLKTDAALSLACQALDWGVGPLLIPEQFRPFFPREESGEYPGVMRHDPSILALAVEPQLNAATLDEPRGLVYRHCFVRLFDHLENIAALLEDGQLRKEDLGDLKYWLTKLHDYPYAPDIGRGMDVFRPALEDWGYVGIAQLAILLEVKGRTASP